MRPRRRVRAVLAVLSTGLLALAACGDEGTGGDPGYIDATGPGDATGPVGGDGGAVPGEPPGLAGITQLHNEVRAAVGVAPLVWDPELAAVAQAWADGCIDNDPPMGLIDHNDGRSDDYPGYVGENIYGSTGGASAQGAVDAWASEAADYDYDSNSCRPNQVCGHYTQIVWAASERLGCGLADCSGLTYRSTIVCNYSPGGNTGGRPY